MVTDGMRFTEASELRTAVALLDLAALSEDETEETVWETCHRAGRTSLRPAVAAVCVYPRWVTLARRALESSRVRVASVAGDFPRGEAPCGAKVEEIGRVIDSGAEEVDVVISRSAVRRGDWEALAREIEAFRAVSEGVTLKVILAAGDLGGLGHVSRASQVAIAAGADFIKTSTGKERVNATLPAGRVMAQAIREHERRTGRRVGIKPAGGIRTWAKARAWLTLVRRELGDEWVTPSLFRIGASTLLAELERLLPHDGAEPA